VKPEIDFDNIHLAVPSMAYMDSYRAACIVYGTHGVEDFAYPDVATKRRATAYLKKIEKFRRGINLPVGYVPSSGFWLVDGQHYLGSGDIRHYLTDNLRQFGGNIGYSINPTFWRRGLGTLILSMLLDEARHLRIAKPIVTCFDTNTASAKIIEKNGGVLLHKINNTLRGTDRLTRVYEIDLTRGF